MTCDRVARSEGRYRIELDSWAPVELIDEADREVEERRHTAMGNHVKGADRIRARADEPCIGSSLSANRRTFGALSISIPGRLTDISLE